MQPLSDKIHENTICSMSNQVKFDKQKREIEELKTEIKEHRSRMDNLDVCQENLMYLACFTGIISMYSLFKN